MFKYSLDYTNLIHLSKASVNEKKLKITYWFDGSVKTETFANQSDFDDAVAELEDKGLLLIGETWYNVDRLSIAAPNGKSIRFSFIGNVNITHEYADTSEVEDVIAFIEEGFLEFNGKWYQGKQLHVAMTNPSTLEIDYDFLGMDLFKVQYDSQADFEDALDKITAIAEGGGGGGAKRVKTPKITPAGGEVESGTTVTITCATEGAVIHYTTDGTDPTASSPTYSSAITINRTTTVKAIAIKEGLDNSKIATANYHVDIPSVANPVFSPNGGAVDAGTEVTITCATTGAKIYYTTDGSTPDASSTEYTAPIEVTTAVTIKAIGIADDMADSDVVTKAFTIKMYKYEGVINNASPASADDHLPAQSDLTLAWLENLTNVVKEAATNKNLGGMGDEHNFTGISEDNGGRVVYAYPASLGNLTKYIQNSMVQDIGNTFTLMNATIEGVEYNFYIMTDCNASETLAYAFY